MVADPAFALLLHEHLRPDSILVIKASKYVHNSEEVANFYDSFYDIDWKTVLPHAKSIPQHSPPLMVTAT